MNILYFDVYTQIFCYYTKNTAYNAKMQTCFGTKMSQVQILSPRPKPVRKCPFLAGLFYALCTNIVDYSGFRRFS